MLNCPSGLARSVAKHYDLRMTEARTNRRLAAILAADVVGYSRLMANDEAGTLATLKRYRETIFDPAIAAHGGRIFKLIGDGTLVEFASVVDAVKCAVEIQTGVPAVQPAGESITLRIGINLGDVIIEGDDIYGDGVNIAARLEPLAEPGGICVSSIVNESIGNRLDISFKDGGEVQVKNVDRAIRVWKWHRDNIEASESDPTRPPPGPVKETPSIAVLPFDNMSGDPEQDYFSNGMTEDIITDLRKSPGSWSSRGIRASPTRARASIFVPSGASLAFVRFWKVASVARRGVCGSMLSSLTLPTVGICGRNATTAN